ncbi:FtsB family cell division protein [Aquamicrobium defluvii]|uniref:Cell division protein n=1 Tax=Aquamicrobium defluvii TaxID=69279 RepID=A0A011SRD9_9HYPH|nr:septum formation initiator family protein [Aquamicrobium defluvii]EXL01749.1 cell division protein [Aquamicrobium defluvii]EZQ14643.1 cell division protein [Halopseudomonas bauzanensis]TDR31344.1 cell division protein FtsB [Aquamicrobium defluvii]
MWTRQYKQRKTGRLIIPVLCAAFVAYFGFHAYHGQYGINSRERMEEQTARLQAQLGKLQAERGELEKRVRLLHDGTLEKDMLDELARKTLNMSDPDEVIIMLR